jgi:1,4-alpha-glucan branching enzyme
LNIDALSYLAIANQLAKQIYPQVILIAEDVSGFPGLCRPVS